MRSTFASDRDGCGRILLVGHGHERIPWNVGRVILNVKERWGLNLRNAG
jgi:hypothetical protein